MAPGITGTLLGWSLAWSVQLVTTWLSSCPACPACPGSPTCPSCAACGTVHCGSGGTRLEVQPEPIQRPESGVHRGSDEPPTASWAASVWWLLLLILNLAVLFCQISGRAALRCWPEHLSRRRPSLPDRAQGPLIDDGAGAQRRPPMGLVSARRRPAMAPATGVGAYGAGSSE